MRQHLQKIESYLEAHPEQNRRRFQYKIISALEGVDEETAKNICSLQRIIRLMFPPEKDQHERQHEALEELGYNAEAIHNLANGRLV